MFEEHTERAMAKTAAGSAALLARLWDAHPDFMRREFIAGRAERVEAEREEKQKRSFVRVPLLHGRQLIQSVADDFGVSYGELIGDNRTKIFVEARAVVIRVLRDRGWSFPRIAMLLNNRDHSTIIHSHNNYDIYERRNPLVKFCYEKHRPELAVAA